MVLTFIILDDDRIGKLEIINSESLIQELKNPKNNASAYIKTLLYDETKILIDKLYMKNINDSIVGIIRKDINRLLLNGDINYGNELIRTFSFSNKSIEKIKTYRSSNEQLLEGRLILGHIYKGSIKEKPDGVFETLINVESSLITDNFKSPVHYILLILSILTYTLTSVKITFEDIRDVDKVLGYFVEQMGFKKPVFLEEQIIYKPTLLQVFLWGSSKVKARVDGNAIYLTGNIAIIRKLEKMFKSYED